MKNRIITYISNGTMIAGIILGIYVVADFFITRSKLPSNVCPFTKNRPLLYVALAFCIISFILSFFESKAKKKS